MKKIILFILAFLFISTIAYSENMGSLTVEKETEFSSGHVHFIEQVCMGAPESGTLEFCNGKFYITNQATQKAIDRTSDVLLETITVENTTDETVIFTAPMAANSLEAGNVFKLHCDGIVSSDDVGDLITIRLKVGGVTKATLVGAAKKLEEDDWHINANSTQRTIGASGERAIHIHLVIDEVETWVLAVAAIDTTANMDVTVTAQWNNADAGDILLLYQAYLEYKN